MVFVLFHHKRHVQYIDHKNMHISVVSMHDLHHVQPLWHLHIQRCAEDNRPLPIVRGRTTNTHWFVVRPRTIYYLPFPTLTGRPSCMRWAAATATRRLLAAPAISGWGVVPSRKQSKK